MKQWQLYGGRTAQVVDEYKGSERPRKRWKNTRNCSCCETVLFDNNRDEEGDSVNDNRKRTNNKENDSSGAKQQERVEW